MQTVTRIFLKALIMISIWMVLILCTTSKADDNKDKSMYVPLCFETKHCEEQRHNLFFIGTGRGTVGVEQNLYSFGYMRIIPLQHDQISFGVTGNGGDKAGIYGVEVLIGYPF